MARVTPCVALALGGAAAGAGGELAVGHGFGMVAGALVLGAALGLLAVAPGLAWPVAVVALVPMITAAGDPADTAYALVAAHAFGAALRLGQRAAIVAIVALAVAMEIGVGLSHDSAVPALLVLGVSWAGGRVLRDSRAVAARLAERARDLDEEREAYAQLSVRYERARIASELHDIVAHAISVMVVQASAGQRLAADPERAAETFASIADAARQAEADLGRLVALLSEDDAVGGEPDLGLVEELVSRAARTGLDVTLRLEGATDGLPAAAMGLVYRVVQESLTNALRYAAGAPVQITVSVAADVAVEVVNAPAAARAGLAGSGTGNGLRGLRERLGACGGRLEAGPRADGGWRVRAVVPRTAAG